MRIVLFITGIALSFALVTTALPTVAEGSSRAVLLEDLQSRNIDDDIYLQAERPGKVVKVVPWMAEDGSPRVLVVTELGWVYTSGSDLNEWTLVARILDEADSE